MTFASTLIEFAKRRPLWVGLGAVAAIQTIVLGSMVFDRVRLLKTGREIVLPIVPVDPRSLFRGDYVRLSYDVTRVPGSLLTERFAQGDPVYVTIEKSDDGSWRAVKAARTHDGADDPKRVVLKGWLQNDWSGPVPASPDRAAFVRYGIESYFVPEGTGLELEQLAREKKLAAAVAVDRKGNAAIKGLSVDGRLAYEEPLF
jgi:uncharacterized membrane-anchored protein